MIPESRRASATAAIRFPRRAAILSAQVLRARVSLLFDLMMRHAASTIRERILELPALVIRPMRRLSPELLSPGTSPRKASN